MKNCFSPKIVLDNTSRLPLQEQIAEAFRKHIARFRPEAGTRIISEHALSKELEIHRKTVHQAYEILVAEGFSLTQPHEVLKYPPKQNCFAANLFPLSLL